MSSLHNKHSLDGSSTPPNMSFNPDIQKLMMAVEIKSMNNLMTILKAGAKINEHEGSFSETTLHKAVMNCWEEGVHTLLNYGAKVFTKNQFGQTPLHYAACAKSMKCTRLLLQHEQAHADATKMSVNHKDMRGRTALHDAAEQSSVDVIKLLLKAGAIVDDKDKDEETPLHKAAKSCAVPAMLALLNGGANLTARDAAGDSVLSYTLRHIPGGMEALFDSCLVTNTRNCNAKTLEVKFNFIPCISSHDNNQMRCLWNIVEFGHAKLLKHPLCETFLLVKWFKVKKFFYIQFMYYFLYAILTTLLTFDKYLEKSCNCSNISFNVSCVGNMTNYNTGNPEDERLLPRPLRLTMLSVVLVQAILILFNLILSLIYSYKSFKFSLWNVLHVVIILMVFLVLPFDYPNTRYFQQHVASVLQLLLWAQCMLLVGQIPACGIYVVMFTRVAGVFVRIFAVYFSLLLAFTFSFHISEHVEGKTCATILDVFLTFLKTLTMMIGELDYTEEFVQQLRNLPFTSHIIFILFVIMVAIILSNLLVALAVNDVQSLRSSAHLERLIKQMELVYDMEQSFYGMSYLLVHLHLARFSKYSTNATNYDYKRTSVSMSPQKTKLLTVVMRIDDTQYHRQERVPIRLISSVIECLRERQDTYGVDSKASTRPSRMKRLRSTEYSNNEDLKDALKQLESNISDLLCDRLNEVLACNAALSGRIGALENEVRIMRRSQSHASQTFNRHTVSSQVLPYVASSQALHHSASIRAMPHSNQIQESPRLQSHQRNMSELGRRSPLIKQTANMDVHDCNNSDSSTQEDVFILHGLPSLNTASGGPLPEEHDV
uniref:Transient receptor potential channel pyrexia-like n=1 Tax=Hirondellea gigas TaxID=1518452 RepID=A0A6A7FTK1_9CRUS